jgi:PKD repeat protein
MKNIYFLLITLISFNVNAQGTYISANYADVNDNFFLTNVSNLLLDYETTGANFNWNYGTLTDISQDKLNHRAPNQTGYVWSYLLPINGNTNLSSSNGQNVNLNIGGVTIGTSNNNDYFMKTTTQLTQVANNFRLELNGLSIPVNNEFSNSDILYNFPIEYGDTDTDNSEYTVNIPNTYYLNRKVTRTNEVDGWGTVTTPFGTFSNSLRMKTTLVQSDTISILGNGLPRINTTKRELKWFDVSKKYPVLIVTQNLVSSSWVTTNVQYQDIEKTFQSIALFAYTPIPAILNQPVYFQNLSQNSTTYSWNFGDPTSSSNTSALQNPEHTFSSPGTYQVQLTASNATFTDSITIPVIVSDVLSVNEVNLLEKATVYPNPFSDNINFSDENDNNKFELINIERKIILTTNQISNHNLSNIQKGIYFLKVTNINGTKIFKLLKK